MYLHTLHAYIASRLITFYCLCLNFKKYFTTPALSISRTSANLKDFELPAMPIATIPKSLTLSQIPLTWISREGGLQFILALLVLVLGFLARSLLHVNQTRVSSPEEDRETHKALEALLAVLNPPNSRWPYSYIALARAAARSGSRTIHIPLVELVQDLLNGIVELRDASALGELMAGRRVYGWRFNLCAGERERGWMKQAQKSRAQTWNEVHSLLCL